jgi:hypothetical protein
MRWANAARGRPKFWTPASGRLSLLGTLELPVTAERLKSLAAGAVVVIENDAVGVEAGYLPGLGERTPRLAAFAPPASAPRVVSGHRGSTDAEVAAAVAALSIEPAAPGAG